MAGSTYSSNLKIELMTTGENSGTWGDVTNTNLGTALEQAVIGLGNPDYASDANLTISITNSNAAQAARALVLNVTSTFGSLTATRELVVPTIQKQYIVQNNTTGGQSITVKTSAGTGITVPNGRKAHLYVNGTDVIQMFDFVDINGGSIDGTPIGASSASTGAFTTLNASGATTLDGNVTLGNASGDTVTVTGTIASNLLFTDNTYDIGANGATRPRNLYLAGAATIGGNLSVGGTLTLTGGLTLNGNVTVGDNAADTLTINSTVTSNLIFTDNTYDIGASGATRPRNLFIAGNITAGGNQTLTGSLTVDSTTNSTSGVTGSIQTDGGIGVAKDIYVAGSTTLGDASADTVTINGTITSNLIFTDNTYDIGASGATRPRNLYLSNALTAGSSATIGSSATVGTYFAVGGNIDSGVSIYARNTNLSGTAQYGALLNITASSAASTAVLGVSIRNATAAAAFTTGYSAGVEIFDTTKGAGSTITSQYGVYVNDMTVGTSNYGVVSNVSSGSNKWNIYSGGTATNYFNGSVGVGTNNPATKLQVNGTVTILATSPYLTFNNGSQELGKVYWDNSTNAFEVNNVFNGPLLFKTNNTERMRVSGAALLIGQGASNGYGLLQVAGGIVAGTKSSATGSMYTFNQTNDAFFAWGSASDGSYHYINSNYDTTAGVKPLRFVMAGASSSTPAMTLTATNRLGIGITTPVSNLEVYNATTPSYITSSIGDVSLDDVIGGINAYSRDSSTTSTGGVGSILIRAKTAFNTSYTPTYMQFNVHATTANDGSALGNVFEAMRISETGQLQILSTTNPDSANLYVASTSVVGNWTDASFGPANSYRGGFIHMGSSSGYYGTGVILACDVGVAQGGNRIISRYAGSASPALVFEYSTNSQSYGSNPLSLTYAEGMRFTSTGQLLIGKTSGNTYLNVNTAFDYLTTTFTSGAGNYGYLALPQTPSTTLMLVDLTNNNNGNLNASYLLLVNTRNTGFGGGNGVTVISSTQGSTGTSGEISTYAFAISGSGTSLSLRATCTLVSGSATIQFSARIIQI